MLRDAEKQFLSSLRHVKLVETYAYLSKVYIRLDQPLSAIDYYKTGLELFPYDVTLTTGLARIYEVSGEMEKIYFLQTFLWSLATKIAINSRISLTFYQKIFL